MIAYVLLTFGGGLIGWGARGIVVGRRFSRALRALHDDQRRRNDPIYAAEAAERISEELWPR